MVARRPFEFNFQTDYWVLLAVQRGENTNYDEAAAAARRMEEAMSQFVPLLKPGTARGEAPGSRAKPDVWSRADDFSAAVDRFTATTTALAAASSTGDQATYAAAFDDLHEACTACHGFRPSSGGPFRFAMGE